MISPQHPSAPGWPRSASTVSVLNLDLVRKYASAAPRYTSFPPATQFHTDVTAVDLDAALQADNEDAARPLSLYVHLPFCASLCWYCGCNTIITQRRGAAEEYLDLLEHEVALMARRVRPDRLVTQVHLGGGTPTYLSPEQLARLFGLLRRYFSFARDAEISVELDPRRTTAAQIEVLAQWGMNRASLGI